MDSYRKKRRWPVFCFLKVDIEGREFLRRSFPQERMAPSNEWPGCGFAPDHLQQEDLRAGLHRYTIASPSDVYGGSPLEEY
jgi:hypothetical protein